VGGWTQAARLPFDAALSLAEDHLKTDLREAFRHAQLCYHSSLPIFANGGDIPDPPELDDYED
jgi:hypothetical protein